ncbi:uncharacterized protein LOC143429526 [Xylocopa sonorina]|uniref:uncharacterized protein LOC143429526 n=1 Tax=Xylocopa sonorina TaxID=1818115 RepID=UPI00403AAAB5
MQSKNFLFGGPNLKKQTPLVLFTKYDFEQTENSNAFNSRFSQQFNVPCQRLSDENECNSFYTPLMEKKPVSIPKAPVKHKNQPKKFDLRPKKLQYSDDESDSLNTGDSGIHLGSSHLLNYKQHTSKSNRFGSSQERRLETKLNNTKVQTSDKENDKNVIRNTSVNVSNNGNNKTQSSVVFNSNAEALSQCDANLDWKNQLRWLQPRRDIGLWIECCRKKCKKWRFTDDYHDPTEVPNIWYCEMNSDKSIASCDIPECRIPLAIESTIIHNAFNAGSIVWAHIKGFPWWPGIVNDCPDTLTFYKRYRKSRKVVSYFVSFFGEEKFHCAWLGKKNLKPFRAYKYSQLIKRTKIHGVDYKELLQKAYEMATNALSLSILERLQKFSYIAHYENFHDVNNNLSLSHKSTAEIDTDTDSDIISNSYNENNYISLKEFYLNIIRKKSVDGSFNLLFIIYFRLLNVVLHSGLSTIPEVYLCDIIDVQNIKKTSNINRLSYVSTELLLIGH